MKITRGSKLDSISLVDLNSGQVFEYKRHIGMVTTENFSGTMRIVYLNSGEIEDLPVNTKVRKMKATMRVDY